MSYLSVVCIAGKYEAAPDDSQVPGLRARQFPAAGLHHAGQQELALHLPGQLGPLPALRCLRRSEEAGRGGGGESGGQTAREESNPVWIGVESSGELTLTTPITTSSQQYFVQHKTRRNVTTCLSAEEKNCFPFESDRFLSSFYFIHLEKYSRRGRKDFDLLRHFSNLI